MPTRLLKRLTSASTAGEVKVNFRKVHDHIHSVIGAIAPNDSVERFRAMGVTVIEAEARFVDKTTVMAGDTEIRARRYVIATGSSPLVAADPGPRYGSINLTNETLFERTSARQNISSSSAAGPIGMEMGPGATRRLGAEVTGGRGRRGRSARMIPELAAIVLDRLRAEGVTHSRRLEGRLRRKARQRPA